MYQWCTNGYKWWVFGIYLNSLEGNRISCCVWVTYQNYPKISKVVCKPNSGVLELCFKKNQTYYRKCCFDETDCFAMVASKFKMSRLYKALGSWFRQANSTRENISMYIHLITWMGLSANWIYMDIPQNIIKHPFRGKSLSMMNHPISEVSYFQTNPSQCADTCKAPSYASMNCYWLYLFYLHVCCPSLPPTAVRFVVSTSVKESSHITRMDNSWQFNRFQNTLQILVWRTQDISMPFASGWHPMNNYMAVCQNLVPLVNIKIAGKWMFIPLKIVLLGIDP